MFFRRAVLVAAAIISLVAAESTLARTEKRVALVIGNSAYRNAVALANPERDARAIADKLRGLGFVVVEGYDLDHDSFKDTIKDFAVTVRGADIGLFYYAGHGMQVNGRNYFVPVDAAFQDVTALDFEAVPLDLVTRQMQNDVAVRLVVLDACRDNPLSQSLSRSMAGTSRSTSIEEGLAEVKIADAGEGTAIIFATSPDAVALDGEGDHSPFTQALLQHMDAADTPLQVVMSRVTGDVYAATKQQQRPWMNASLTCEFFLNPVGDAAVANADPRPKDTAPSADDGLEREKILYNLAQQSGSREDFEAYLEVFPAGMFAVNARKQIERLDREAQSRQVASATPPPAADLPSRTIAAPGFELPITDEVRAAPADEMTEAALELDRAKRGELQTRLTLAGFDTGAADGSFGPRSRRALQAWQGSRGLAATGYLNQPQYELLVHQTETAFAVYVPPKPAATPVRTVKPVAGGRKPQRQQRNGPRRDQSGPDAAEVGRFVGGVIGGMIRY